VPHTWEHGYSPGAAGSVPARSRSRAGVLVIVVGLLLGAAVAVFLGVQAFAGAKDSPGDGSPGGVAEGSGEFFSPPNKPYRVEIPPGMVRVPLREDRSIPSETDLSLELDGKVQAGGLIKTGTLSGQAATGTFDAVGEEAARAYADQYEGDPEQWGTGAKVDKDELKVGGRNAVEITARFSPSGKPEPSTYFRVYFVDAPSGPPILITCDWNVDVTADIEGACDTLVASFQVTS
jgi:hypothetical protein